MAAVSPGSNEMETVVPVIRTVQGDTRNTRRLQQSTVYLSICSSDRPRRCFDNAV